MKLQNVPRFLKKHAVHDIVVEFDDGDRYPSAALDFQGENEDGEFEIYVSFDDCLGRCRGYEKAIDAGPLDCTPRCWWTSEKPRRPVGMTYTLGRIKSIRDDEAGYYVFEKT